MTARILIVDDESSIRVTFREFLRDADYEVDVAEDADEALHMMAIERFDVVVTDIIMPQITGVALLKAIKEASPHVQVVLMTGEPTVETSSEAVREGACDYLSKPIGKEQLLKTIANATRIKALDDERRRLAEENRQYQEKLEKLVEERTVALRESEEKFRAIFEQAAVGVAQIASETGEFVLINQRYADILGYTIEEMEHLTFQEITHPDDLPESLDNMQRLLDGKIGEFSMEKRKHQENGSLVWVNLTVSPMWKPGEDPNYHIAVLEDITERKRVEQELSHYQLRLRKLASELTLTEERLKRTVARELHDRISQSLAGAKMMLLSLRESMSDLSLQKKLSDIAEVLTESLKESRSLTSRLSYPALDILGLTKAIKTWVEDEISVRHGLGTRFVDDGMDKPLDEDTQAVLFRSVREVLNNIIKHARAKNVTVTVKRLGGEIVVSVTDDGVGFDPQSIREKAVGFGILSIQESLARLDGRLEIVTGHGSGCEVILSVPLRVAAQAKDSGEGG